MFWPWRRGAKSRSRTPSIPENFVYRGHELLLVRKPYRRSISMTLQISGNVKITAPKSLPQRKLLDFLDQHAEWIENNLRAFRELRARYPEKSYRDGDVFLFMGRELRLELVPSAASGIGHRRAGEARVEARDDRLRVWLPEITNEDGGVGVHSSPGVLSELRQDQASLDQAWVRPRVMEFYQKEGRRFLNERLWWFANKMALRPQAVSFRSQKTRWGSCSSAGKISLNWRLIFAPLDVIDYVVIHELCHLRHYNHSRAFWELVATESPDYARHKSWLRDHQYDADFLAKSSELHPQAAPRSPS